MSEAYAAVLDGTDADGIDVQQIIDGITGARAVPHTFKNDDASYAATFRNSHSAGRAFRWRNPGDTADLLNAYYDPTVGVGSTVVGDVFKLAEGTRFVAGTYVPTDTGIVNVGAVNARAAFVMADFTYEHTGSTADVGAFRAIMSQTSGGNAVGSRAAEMHMIKRAGNLTSSAIGADISVSSSIAGTGTYGSVGAWIRNFGTTFGISTPQIIDTGLLIGAGSDEMTNYIMVKSTPGLATMFSVVATGIMTSGRHDPLSNNAYDIGTTANIWRTGYINQVRAGNGVIGAVGLGFNSDGTTGLNLSATNAIGIITNGAEQIRVTSAGHLDFRNSQVIAVVAAGGAATLAQISGGPAANAQTHWLKVRDNGTLRYAALWT